MTPKRWVSPHGHALAYTGSPGGPKPTLLLLHGVARCGEDWAPLLPALQVHWNIVTLDHRGHGDSERAQTYFITDYAEDATAFLREIASDPWVLLGHSLGAMVAAAVAARVPEYVRAVILEDPPFHTMGKRIQGTGWQALFKGMQTVALDGGTPTEITDKLAQIEIPGPDGKVSLLGALRTRDALQWSAECLNRVDPAVFAPLVEGRWLEGFPVDEVLARINCPTLLLQADPHSGGACSDADALAALNALNLGSHRRFEAAGHQLHREHPDAVLNAIADFRLQTNPTFAPHH